MSDRPHFSAGERPEAAKLEQVSERAYHSHSSASGIDGPGGLALSAEPKRREWEWAKLQEDLLEGDEAEARLYRDVDDLAVYMTVDVKAPPTWAVNDALVAGSWVIVMRHRPSIWYAITKPANPPEVYFELKDALSPGATVTAYLRVDGVTDTDIEFEVKDIFSKYRGRAKDAFSSPHNRGSLGRAVLFRGVWEIRELEAHAMKIKALIDMGSGLLTTDSNITIDTVTITQPEGAILYAGPITEVANVLSVAGDDDGIVFAEWNQNLAVWEGVPACPV